MENMKLIQKVHQERIQKNLMSTTIAKKILIIAVKIKLGEKVLNKDIYPNKNVNF